MNADRLLTLYEKVAEAPDAIARLRRFVLDLAVRGKLVAQEAGDEPAPELLKRIAAEKARLVKAGEIKRPKPVDPEAAGEMAFPTPPGWTWTRLADIAVCLDYMRKPINGTERDKRIEGKAEDELFPYYGATQQQGWIDDYIFDEELVLLGEDGVPFFDPYRSKAYTISGKTWVNNHAHVFKGILISHPFLAHYLNVFDYTGRVVGATRSKLNQARAVGIPVPLPPLAEQRRIVEKVAELMALLDRLEAARTAREATRDRLTAASLARLTAPETAPADFPANARFALATLPALTTRPDQIKPLRQTILNLAVRGKLVEQDPTDEPASELLKRIASDKKKRAVSARDRRAGAIKPLLGTDLPFDLPASWHWVAFGDITISRDGERVPVSKADRENRAKTYDYYGASGVIDKIDGYLFDKPLLLIGEDGANLINRSTPIAFIARGKYWVNNHAHVLDGLNEQFLRYLELFINATDLKPFVTGTAQPKMNQAKMNSIPVALPPLAEQHRIVAKVDALMALCDRLEAALTTTDTTRARLLEALLHEALDPAAEAVTEAAE